MEEGTNNGGNWDRCQWEEETDILGRGQISVEKVVKCQCEEKNRERKQISVGGGNISVGLETDVSGRGDIYQWEGERRSVLQKKTKCSFIYDYRN